MREFNSKAKGYLIAAAMFLGVAGLVWAASTAADRRWTASGVEELSLTSAALRPVTDGGLDLGTAAKSFNDLVMDGDATIGGTLGLTGATTLSSLTVSGGLTDIGSGTYTTAAGDNDIGVAGDAEIEGILQADGALDANSTANFQGIVTLQAALNGPVEAVTGAETIDAWGSSELDGTSAGGAGAALTLGSATVSGTLKTVSMQEATTSFSLTVTNHATSDPEIFLFDAVDEALLLLWTGTEWVTVNATGVSTP